MTLPLISLLHPTMRVTPSEAFPQGWQAAHDAWLARADHPERIEYVLAVHESRWAQYTADVARNWNDRGLAAAASWFAKRGVMNAGRDCCVDQLNTAAAASRGALLIGIQDDLYPPEHWDTLLLEALRPSGMASYLDAEAILVCSSGTTPERDRELMIAGALTRARYERYGWLLDPDFESMFADNHYVWQARRDEAAGLVTIIERLDIKFEHRHPIFGLGAVDDAYRVQNREIAYQQGQAILHQKMTGAKVMVICLPGESFRNEWVGTTFQTIQALGGMGYITAPHWCYTSNVYCTRIELAQGALEFRPKADYVAWWDDDNLVTGAQLQMLVKDLESHPDLGGVVGWCWCDHNQSDGAIAATWRMSVGRQRVSDLLCMRLTAEDLQAAYERSPLITSDDVAPDAFWSGFPCVLMRRSALELLGPEAFAPQILNVKYGFTGEDTALFWNAHRLGIKFAVDIRVKVPHVKWRAIEPAFVPGARPQAVKSLNRPSESSAAD